MFSKAQGHASDQLQAPTHSTRATPTIAAAVFSTLLPCLALADEDVYLSDIESHQVLMRGAGGGGMPAGGAPMNCDEVVFPRTDLRAIHQSTVAAPSQVEADRRYRTEVYVRAAVLNTSSTINGYLTSGTLHGVELDWFFPGGTDAPTTVRLAEASNIYESDGNGGWDLVCKLYCYDTAQYNTRKSAIETAVGHALDSRSVWIGATATSTGTGGERLQVSGSACDIYGDTESASGAKIEGTGNAILDGVYHKRPVSIHATNSVAWDESVTSVPAPVIPFTEANARLEAQTNGSYYANDIVITASNAPNNGVIFSEGNITVSGAGLTGSWTFVSALGTVSLSGADLTLTPFQDEALAVAFAGDVEISGIRAETLGEIHAPDGMAEVSADNAYVHGRLCGDRVHVTGDNTVVTDGSDPI